MGAPKNEADQGAHDLFKQFAIAFVAGDEQGLKKCLTENFEWNLPTGVCYKGRAAAIEVMASRAKLKDGPKFSNSRIEVFGDTIVQRYKVAVPAADGERVELEGLDVYKIENDCLASKDAYWKQLNK